MKPYIHPRTPPKLKAAFKASKNLRGEGYRIHVLAEKINVNVSYLWNMFRYGKEPTDTTEKGRTARARMFLPKKIRKPKNKPGPQNQKPLPNHMIWWRSLDKDTRNTIIRSVWVQLNGSKP